MPPEIRLRIRKDRFLERPEEEEETQQPLWLLLLFWWGDQVGKERGAGVAGSRVSAAPSQAPLGGPPRSAGAGRSLVLHARGL